MCRYSRFLIDRGKHFRAGITVVLIEFNIKCNDVSCIVFVEKLSFKCAIIMIVKSMFPDMRLGFDVVEREMV